MEIPVPSDTAAMADRRESLDLKTILTSTKVGEPILRGVPVLGPTDRVSDAATEMRSRRQGSAVICSGEKLVGIITERDVLRIIERGGRLDVPLGEVMTANPQTVTTNDTLMAAIRLMVVGGYRRVPVVDETGRPVGVVDVKTVTHFLVEYFAAAVYNQASHAQLTAKRREGA